MALIVQTTEPMAGANSYVSLSDATTYFTARGYPPTPAVTEGHLLRATDFLNSYFNDRFKGDKVTGSDSSMEWPRVNFVLEGVLITNRSIPKVVKDAQMEIALEIANEREPFEASSAPKIISQRVDVIETKYAVNDPQEPTNRFNVSKIRAILRPVLNDRWYRVVR